MFEATAMNMEVRDKLTVQEWDEPALPRRESSWVSAVSWKSPALLGVLGTFVFHLILVASLGLSFGGRTNVPNKADQNRIGAVSSSEPLILLSLSAIPRSSELRVDLRSPSKVLDTAPLVLLPAPSVTTDRLTLVDESAMAGNAELAQAAENYDRQIRARIARIWQRPQAIFAASPAEAGASGGDRIFQCQAQLEQDDRGNVMEVLLPVCNGSSEWRESLLLAIRQASPLPAPPDPRVFSSSLVLHFVVLASSANGALDDYK
jgi:hypothetical protein